MERAVTRRELLEAAGVICGTALAGCGRVPDGDAPASEMATAVAPTADGPVVAATTAQAHDGPQDVLVVGHGPAGERWRRRYSSEGSTFPVSMAEAPDGDLIVAANRGPRDGSTHGWLLRVGPDGSERWTRTYGTEYEGGWAIGAVVPIGESDFLLVGAVSGEGPFGTPTGTDRWEGSATVTPGLLVRIDGSGTPKWFDRTHDVELRHAIPDRTGVTLAGRTPSERVSTPAAYNTWIGSLVDGSPGQPVGNNYPAEDGDHLDAVGTPVALAPHPESGSVFLETGGGIQYSHVSRAERSSTDLVAHVSGGGGRIAWRRAVDPFREVSSTLMDLASGTERILAVGSALEGGTGDLRDDPEEAGTPYAILVVLSVEGTVRRSRVFRDEGIGFFTKVAPLEGGFLCVGARSQEDAAATDGWAVRVDESGEVTDQWTFDRHGTPPPG